MSTLPSESTPVTDQGEGAEDAVAKKRNKLLKQAVTTCKNYRRKLVRDWSISTDYLRGKPFASQSDEDRVAVNIDWSYVKMKQAALFSQVPAVRVNHPPDTTNKDVLPWLHGFEQRINDTLISAGIETAMDEVLPDCINAAGIGVAIVSHEALTEMIEVPAVDLAGLPPEVHQQVLQTGMMPDGQPVPMTTVPKVIDHRYVVSRISPADFLWPISFSGGDFDNAAWIGRSGRVTWAEAQRRWNLDEAKKNKYLGIERLPQDTISNDTEREADIGDGDELVSFDEVFYKEEKYNVTPKKFAAIHHVIFINGDEKPVVDEPWQGQQFDEESGELIGCLRYPIRVLSLSYVTDDAIPPSDSAIARPQVNEINKSRTQMILQREHSLPVRWFDVNRVDPTIQFNLMKGTWQGMIPVQGNGDTIIGEVARSSMPQENMAFYRMAMEDLSMMWQVGQEHNGLAVETKGEADVIQANAQTRIGRERAKVGKFFTSVAEILGGLICIYEDPNTIGKGFVPAVSKTLAYSILADSTVLLDSNQRLKRINDFLNLYAKSGWVNLEPVLKEAATLSGLDPQMVIRPPAPKPPVEPNISLRLTGTEDMMNPLTLAMMIKAGQAPSPEQIEEAKKLIELGVTPPPQPIPQLGPDGQLLPPDATMTPGPPTDPAPPGTGDANPQMSAMPKINQRQLERGNSN
jgi:hypothetical protein